MKKFLPIIIIAVLAVVAAGVFIFWRTNGELCCINQPLPNTQQNQAGQSVAVDDKSDWKTYVDTEHGFEFKYFSNNYSTVVSDGRPTGLIFSVEKDGLEALFGNFQRQASMNTFSCPKNLKNTGQITIDGEVVSKCTYFAEKVGPIWNAIIQKKNSANSVDVYTISCNNEHKDFESYCEQVLSTFKFTK